MEIASERQSDSASLRAFWHSPALVWGIVAFGIAMRTFHYLRDPGVWMDELWLMRNIVSKGFVQLIGPLGDMQAAPPLFLWVEHAMSLLLGNSSLALRLFPYLASCATLVLFVVIARTMLRPAAVPWAMLLLACSDKVIDHSIEAKQYGIDTFVAVLVPALYCAMRNWSPGRQLAVFSLIAPLVIFMSYPGCFIMGGVLVALLPTVWHSEQRRSTWPGYVLLALVTFGAFAILLLGPVRAQHTANLHDCWEETFPTWSEPWTVPLWSINAWLGLADHSFRPLGGALIPAIIVGGVSLWRRGLKAELLLVIVPVLAAMLAAWMKRYPFESRVMLYATVSLALLAGEGVVVIAGWLPHALDRWLTAASASNRTLVAGSLCVLYVLLLLPAGLAIGHLIAPWSKITYPWPEPPSLVKS